MFILGILSWWYGAGWRQRVAMLREKIMSTMDYFSIDLLAKTLFSPFRQISAGKVQGPLGVQLRAFADRIISRAIGGMIRTFMIIIGTAAILLYSVIGGVFVILWGTIPLLPVVGIALFISGWVPWTL